MCVLVALRVTLQVEDENLQDLWSERPVCVPIWVSPLVCREYFKEVSIETETIVATIENAHSNCSRVAIATIANS